MSIFQKKRLNFSKKDQFFDKNVYLIYEKMGRHGVAGRLLILVLGGTQNMTSYEIAMLVIAVLSLIVNAIALFTKSKE